MSKISIPALRAGAIIATLTLLAGCSDPPQTTTTTSSSEQTTTAPPMMIPSTVTTRTTNTQTMPYNAVPPNNNQ
ncbi:hypothetical protein ACOSOMT5_P1683 [Acidiphilium sp. MT5]